MVRRKSAVRSSSQRSSISSKSKTPTETASRTTTLVNRPRRRMDKALNEIKYLQKTTKLLIPKAPFAKLVRQIMYELFPRLEINRIQVTALEALQEAMELYLVQFFEDSILLSLHAKRVTLYPGDMRLVRRIRGRNDVINR